MKGSGSISNTVMSNTGYVPPSSDTGNPPLDIGGVNNNNAPAAVLQWVDLANKYALIHSNLDPEEILAIIWNESSGNPNAQNPNDPSWGLMGVTLPIGITYADVSAGTDLLDPETNIQAGSGYLADLKSQFGSASNWTEAYNEGPGNYQKGLHYNPSYAVNFNARVLTLKEDNV